MAGATAPAVFLWRLGLRREPRWATEGAASDFPVAGLSLFCWCELVTPHAHALLDAMGGRQRLVVSLASTYQRC
jgi:hypothetical protein